MKTELEIANERILELEEQVKKLTANTILAGRCSSCKFWNTDRKNLVKVISGGDIALIRQ